MNRSPWERWSALGDDPGDAVPEGASAGWYRAGRWAGRLGGGIGYRVLVNGEDRLPVSGPVVVVANHTSFADGPLLFGLLARPSVFLVKESMFRGPLGALLRRLGQLPVRRGQTDREVLLTAVRRLRAGGVVGVFPEGTRGAGAVDTAHHGAAWLARSSGAVVLPVAVRGTRREAGSSRRLRPTVHVLFGQPLTLPDARGRAGLTAATERVREELAGLVRELDRRRLRTRAGAVEGHPDSSRGERT
ncbi:lysophospholipid acyltransferase family protein [Actinoalloteichus spitiensis]|uniref:lysophospholipid acyltransferase family protein n=1 Tax=Actinoalloteichus spitiensis TaxID=252394 RepID=UPI0003693400|nr:lysophospholipid acyltransferase family protein [Actinoalloteichus spitiensis]